MNFESQIFRGQKMFMFFNGKVFFRLFGSLHMIVIDKCLSKQMPYQCCIQHRDCMHAHKLFLTDQYKIKSKLLFNLGLLAGTRSAELASGPYSHK